MKKAKKLSLTAIRTVVSKNTDNKVRFEIEVMMNGKNISEDDPETVFMMVLAIEEACDNVIRSIYQEHPEMFDALTKIEASKKSATLKEKSVAENIIILTGKGGQA